MILPRLLLLLTALAGCKATGKSSEAKGGAITVAPATYGDDSHAPKPAREECKFHDKVAQAIAKKSSGSVGDGGGGTVLRMTITHMRGADPGWQGDISVIVLGELDQDGSTIGTFKLRRSARSGALGGKNGVCKGLQRVANLMADDVSKWLDKPSQDARLGESKR